MDGISVVMPAYRAESTITLSVASVILQTHQNWELLIVSDDNADYEQILGRAGISDPRIRFLSTGTVHSGSPKARNLGIDAASHRYSAILDADDYMHPDKLAIALDKVKQYPIVSCALTLVDQQRRLLRTVGAGANTLLGSDVYKYTNYSSDSMLVYDRHKTDPRFDLELECVTDVDFLLRLFQHCEVCYHIGTPLHWYVKRRSSVTNGAGASERIIRCKKIILERLASGYYSLKRRGTREHFEFFYNQSLAAEIDFSRSLISHPSCMFEDFIEAYLQPETFSRRGNEDMIERVAA